MVKFSPLRDHLLVRPFDRLKHLSSVIQVISDFKDTRGEVVAAGPGLRLESGELIPMDVKVGDRVCYGNGTYLDFHPIYLDGERFLVMREADICFVEEESLENKLIDNALLVA